MIEGKANWFDMYKCRYKRHVVNVAEKPSANKISDSNHIKGVDKWLMKAKKWGVVHQPDQGQLRANGSTCTSTCTEFIYSSPEILPFTLRDR